MKKIFSIIGLSILSAFLPDTGFVSSQKKYERVRTAYKEKENILAERLKNFDLTLNNLQILIVAYKSEKKLDIYAKSKTAATYSLFHTYDICASSGRLGPKRMEGDGQVPEGFYHINRFNPNSSYYLSLGLNYPNLADKKKSTAGKPGSDIFIHGECVTIGCLPMTNDKIKEIYLLAVQACQNGQQKIPVYVFPFQLTDENVERYHADYASNTELLSFWRELKKGYDLFQKEHKELRVTIDEAGNYKL